MTQFADPFASPPGGPVSEPPKTSGLAIASLVCSLLGCCPIVTSLLGVILGGAAMVSIGGNPARKGRGLAVTGLLLGVIGLVAWGAGIAYVAPYVKEAFGLVQTGPADALSAAANGDAAAFKADFWGDAASASDEAVLAFIADAEGRYGAYQGCRFDQQAQAQRSPSYGQPIVAFPYILDFADASVDAEVEIVFSDPLRGGFVMKFGSITIVDPDRGDLIFPPPTDGGGP